jgi:mannose-1-phosphate guanylyltransferase/mannose-6-phosphate isomerase
MANHNYAILLAGGQGSRFWPQSRTLEPKQFLALHKDKSLIVETIIRVRQLIPSSNIFIASSELYRNQIIELIEPFKIPLDNLVFEPDGKNTAPSIAVTVGLIDSRDTLARICVLPCDHLIKDNRRFLDLISKGLRICQDNLVIFGIPPTRPATGYGYIQVESLRPQATGEAFKVKRFTEKPDHKTAERFLKSGDYYWNGGIFLGTSAVFLDEFKASLPDLYKLAVKIKKVEDIGAVWRKIKPVSFDYGIMEKAGNVTMLRADNLGWSDLGSWQAWDEILKKDDEGNIFKADVINFSSKNITVVGNNRLIATIGLENLIVVDTPDALLITRKDKTEDVKKVVELLKEQKRSEHYEHKTVKRPWGAYTVLELGEGFKVKLVEVKPGKALSLQYHKKRSEHWVVVEGTARIVKGKRSFIFEANESTYIPIGCAHRLSNPLKDKTLKIIEVQAGKYLEEDDIVRIKDDFGRTGQKKL